MIKYIIIEGMHRIRWVEVVVWCHCWGWSTMLVRVHPSLNVKLVWMIWGLINSVSAKNYAILHYGPAVPNIPFRGKEGILAFLDVLVKCSEDLLSTTLCTGNRPLQISTYATLIFPPPFQNANRSDAMLAWQSLDHLNLWQHQQATRDVTSGLCRNCCVHRW